MAQSLLEYAAWLGERDLLWPAAPETVPAKATPSLAPLLGVKGVMWDVYGTLLTIADGRLLLEHPQSIRMQIALEKTIQEFNMWNSMTRRPGQPWEYLLPKYTDYVAEAGMQSTGRKGDYPAIDAGQIWQRVIQLLGHKDYQYDVAFYGDTAEYCEKIAYFFQRCLQGISAAPLARETLTALQQNQIRQGLLSDAQPFTLAQLVRELDQQGPGAELHEWLTPGCAILSQAVGVRKPSPGLFEAARAAWAKHGLQPEQVLYVGSVLAGDLAVARGMGFRTALYAGNRLSLQATAAECRSPELKPDRLLTKLSQVTQLVGL